MIIIIIITIITIITITIIIIDWNSFVYASPLNDISRLSFRKTERLPRMHIPSDFINEYAIYLDPCDSYLVVCFSFFCKLFLPGANKISRIHGSFHLSPASPEVWNFHARPEECVRYISDIQMTYEWHRNDIQVHIDNIWAHMSDIPMACE